MKTAQKIALARLASAVIAATRRLFGRATTLKARRGGILWLLDLKEGIDFSIYLLGGFEPKTLALYRKLVRPGDLVLDIGANVGSHTLPLAQLVAASGQVIAFEPTAFAIAKLRANLALNAELIPRVVPVQAMLVASDGDALDKEIFSSWPLEQAPGLHHVHKGRLMSTAGAIAVPLDDWVESANPARIDFIKIDVDGHEPAVFLGARKTLARFRPTILLEMAPYLFRDQSDAFEAMLEQLATTGYTMIEVATGKTLALSAQALNNAIPDGGSANVLLRIQ
jgi:FkbM family methyltransferase